MRKGKYQKWLEPENLILLEGWARDGLTEQQIAEKKMHISYSTFKLWKDKFSAISAAIKKGKEVVDFEVENALLKSALGYHVTVRKPIKVKIEKQLKDKGKIVEERIEYADEDVYVSPQATAQIFWLKNRKPDKWRDRPAYVEEAHEQDSGLTAALLADVDELFQEGDDSDMVTEEATDEE